MNACLPCFSSRYSDDEDREPLLQDEPEPWSPPLTPPRQPLSKLADILGALSVGKLPSQTQINQFLQHVLRLELLRSARDPQSAATPEVLKGDGPLSTRGRKVIQDVEEVVQALLQFGIEKNDDDLIQDMLFQMTQIDLEESPMSLGSHDETTNRRKVSEEVNKSNESPKKPGNPEIVADAKTMATALKSLCLTFLTSSVFRLILSDVMSIGRDLAAQAASDVSRVAVRVRDFAEDVEEQAENAEFPMGQDSQERISLRQVVGELADASQSTANAAVRGVQESIEEEKQEWREHVTETEEEVRRRLLVRIQEVVVRAQEDSSSREAVMAILQIIRKYAHKFVRISQETVASIQEADGGTCSSSGKGENASPQQEIPITYPPKPRTVEFTPVTLIPGIEINSPHLQRVLQDLKLIIERLAPGHRIDDIMKTLGDVVQHTITTPREVRETVEKFIHETLQSSEGDPGAAQHNYSAGEFGEPSKSSAQGRDSEDTRNVFAIYFSNVGTYLDKALNEPGWATSKTGQEALDVLYDATRDLMHIADDVIANTKEVVKEKMEEVQEDQENDRGNNVAIEKAAEGGHKPTTRWVDDIVKLFNQIGDYIDTVQRDKTTMRLICALETLRNDTEDLFGVGRQRMDKVAKELKSWTQKCSGGLGRLGLYTQWVAWAVPKLLHLLPLETIPVPRVEFKTGKVEGAFDALWVRGAALRNKAARGRYGAVSGPHGIAPGTSWEGEAAARGSGVQTHGEGGFNGKLIPDEILVRQWNEMRVTLAEDCRAAVVGINDARSRMGLMGGTKRRNSPGIEVVSRLRVRMDGIKACIRGMGYYFRYNGSVFSYEDEGILSVDLGTAAGDRISGFGLNVELEVDSSDIEMNLLAAKAETAVPVLVEGVDTAAGERSDGPNAPQNQVTQESNNIPGRNGEVYAFPVDRSRTPIEFALANVTPMFRVIGVHADLRGIKFRMERSRHYILNKLFIEPFGGTIVGDIAKHVLEERINKVLEVTSRCMALVFMEAKERAFNKRTKITAKGKRERLTPEEAEEDGEMRMGDVFAVLMERGPEILAYYAGDQDQQDRSVNSQRKIKLDVNGVTYSKQARVRFQDPLATRSAVISPVPLINDESDVDMSREGEETENTTSGEETNGVVEDEEETTVAVGIGSQLFPGRGGPYNSTKDTEIARPGLTEEIGEARRGNGSAKWKGKQKMGKEEGGGWRSLVFDW